MRKIITHFCLFLFFNPFLFGQNILQTIPEQTNYENTSKYADVIRYIQGLKKESKYIRTETIATTEEGKEIPLMIIANPMPKSPRDLQNDSRIVVYIQGNIHAGEVEGKEASLMLAREILKNQNPAILKNIVLLICPILNADGNDKISKENRSHQPGPINGVGVRHNSQFLDLNRDAMKLESAEMKGVVANILNRWDPSVTIDCHTTNGVFRQEPTTFTWINNPNGDRNLIHYLRDEMAPAIANNLKDQYHIENCFFGEFEKLNDSTEVYMSYAHEPRYMINYIGIRNRIAILNENYIYADFKTRVEACYYLLQSTLEYVNTNKNTIKQLIYQADQKVKNRWNNSTTIDSMSFDYSVVPTPKMISIKTFEMESYTDSKGRERTRPTNIKKTMTIPYYADYMPNTSFKIPYGYLLTIADNTVIENLKSHGIIMENFSENQTFEIEKFEIKSIKPNTRLNQGHYTNEVEGYYVNETKTFEKNTYFISTSQPLSQLIVYLLEPLSGEGLLYWNYFDKYLVPQWGAGYNSYPVYRLNNKFEMKFISK